jgi:hypothetical protein
LDQLQNMAVQIANLHIQIAAQQHILPTVLHTHPGGVPQTPPPKKSKTDETTPNAAVDRLKRQTNQASPGDDDMVVDNGGEDGEIPPGLDRDALWCTFSSWKSESDFYHSYPPTPPFISHTTNHFTTAITHTQPQQPNWRSPSGGYTTHHHSNLL